MSIVDEQPCSTVTVRIPEAQALAAETGEARVEFIANKVLAFRLTMLEMGLIYGWWSQAFAESQGYPPE